MPFAICGDDGHGLTQNGVLRPTAGKRTPPNPDGSVIYENEFNRAACAAFLRAVKRCGQIPVEAAAGDEDVALSARTKRCRDAGCAVMLSFHYNAGADYAWGEAKKGVSTHIHTVHTSKRSEELAKRVLAEVVSVRAPRKNRGVGRSAFHVVNENNTKCPAVLLEAGFMDNPTEASWMRDAEYTTAVGEAACKAVCAFLKVPYVAPDPGEGPLVLWNPANPKGTATGAVDIRLLQARLRDIGLDPVWVDGIMGPKTRAAITAAQKALRFKATGEADGMLMDALERLLTEPVDTREAQTLLKAAGFDPVWIDGIMGEKTRAAITAAQKALGLPVTGRANGALMLWLRGTRAGTASVPNSAGEGEG